MYKFRYAVRERRATIMLDGNGVSLELIGPKTAWFLRNLVQSANVSHLTQDAADFRKARGVLHIDGLDAVEEIRKLRGG